MHRYQVYQQNQPLLLVNNMESTHDAWIHNIGNPYVSTSHSGVKPLCMKVPSFNDDPSAWAMFIHMFKRFNDGAVSSDT
jgi:hypothetical protein